MPEQFCDICQRPLTAGSVRTYSIAEWNTIIQNGFSVIRSGMTIWHDGQEMPFADRCSKLGADLEEVDRRILHRHLHGKTASGWSICSKCDLTVQKYVHKQHWWQLLRTTAAGHAQPPGQSSAR